jgi:hypothetical protein
MLADAMPPSTTRLEIAGDRLVCTHAELEVLRVSVEDFVTAVRAGADHMALPDAIPEGVKFIRRQGDLVVLTVEDPPQARTVRWLAEGSRAPKGPAATYDTVRLAFPFVVLVLAFERGDLTHFHQIFYRASPLRTLADPLCYPNLYNCGPKPDQISKLCLLGLATDLAALPWDEKIREIRRHFWSAAFNQSVEMSGNRSFWPAMRYLDPRVSSIARWARATRQDPLFALTVPWQPTGQSVGDVMTAMMTALSSPPRPLASADDLAAIVAQCPPSRQGRKPGPPAAAGRGRA